VEIVKVTRKKQITLPKEVCERARIKVGRSLEYVTLDGLLSEMSVNVFRYFSDIFVVYIKKHE